MDSARSKFAETYQNRGESIAQYYVRLIIQASKCGFVDLNDII